MLLSRSAVTMRRIQSRSAPALNTLPSPSSTITRTASSCDRSPIASLSRATTWSSKALRFSGRHSTTRAMPPSVVTRTPRSASLIVVSPIGAYIRKTGQDVAGVGALSVTASASPSASRVRAGSRMPSSQMRPVA